MNEPVAETSPAIMFQSKKLTYKRFVSPWFILALVAGSFPIYLATIDAIEDLYYRPMMTLFSGYAVAFTILIVFVFVDSRRSIEFSTYFITEYLSKNLNWDIWRTTYANLTEIIAVRDIKSGDINSIVLQTYASTYRIRNYQDMAKIVDLLEANLPENTVVRQVDKKILKPSLWLSLGLLLLLSMLIWLVFNPYYVQAFLLVTIAAIIVYIGWRLIHPLSTMTNYLLSFGTVILLTALGYFLIYHSASASMFDCSLLSRNLLDSNCVRTLPAYRDMSISFFEDKESGELFLIRSLGNSVLFDPVNVWPNLGKRQIIPHDLFVHSVAINQAGDRLFILNIQIQPKNFAVSQGGDEIETEPDTPPVIAGGEEFQLDGFEQVYDLTLIDLDSREIIDRQQRTRDMEFPWESLFNPSSEERELVSVATSEKAQLQAFAFSITSSKGEVNVWEFDEFTAREEMRDSLDEWLNSEDIEIPEEAPLYSLSLKGGVECIRFLPTGNAQLLVNNRNELRVYESHSGDLKRLYKKFSFLGCPWVSENGILAALIAKSGNLIHPHYLELIDLNSGQHLGKINVESFDLIASVSFSPADQYLLVQGDNKIFIYDITDFLSTTED